MVVSSATTQSNVIPFFLVSKCPTCQNPVVLHVKAKIEVTQTDRVFGKARQAEAVQKAFLAGTKKLLGYIAECQLGKKKLGFIKEGFSFYEEGCSGKVVLPAIMCPCPFCGEALPWQLDNEVEEPFVEEYYPQFFDQAEKAALWLLVQEETRKKEIDKNLGSSEPRRCLNEDEDLLKSLEREKEELEAQLFDIRDQSKAKREELIAARLRDSRRINNEILILSKKERETEAQIPRANLKIKAAQLKKRYDTIRNEGYKKESLCVALSADSELLYKPGYSICLALAAKKDEYPYAGKPVDLYDYMGVERPNREEKEKKNPTETGEQRKNLCPNCHSATDPDELFCHVCGAGLRVDFKQQREKPQKGRRCRACGAALDSDEAFCHQCGRPVEQLRESKKSEYNNSMQFCRKCGDRLVPGSAFCKKCGASIHFSKY